ncbi:MAG: type II toxin-antitoxin system death-on-curing family toxin [Candidatus Aenigmarchaeota archaeon]|nr:type II toxin-antitoxin system death-on-curing family toxin [Candidatus Aenigmarchaeota archaeon]
MKVKISKEIVEKYREIITQTHEEIINTSGGLRGIRDAGGLDHAITEIIKSGEKYHKTNPQLASAKIYEMLATRHYFNDGNKRTSHLIAKLSMLSSKIHLKLYYKEAVKFIIDIADNKKTLKEIEDWLHENSSHVETVDEYIKEFGEEIQEMKKWKEEHPDN